MGDHLEDPGAGHNIVATVRAETHACIRADDPGVLRPLGEFKLANDVGAMCASGIFGRCHLASVDVGYTDLQQGAAVGESMDQGIALAPRRLHGVHQITIEQRSEVPFKYMAHRPLVGVFAHEKFRSGFQELIQPVLTIV
jgi:L-fuconolactonase